MTDLDLVQYVHLDKLYGHLPGLADCLPAIFGLTVEEYDASRRRFAEQAGQAAEDLLGDPVVRAQVHELPFRAGDHVLALGDSITDDLQSWVEIVRYMLAIERPADGITMINAGLSAHTSAMVLRRWPATLAAAQPDWVICAIGGNDVTRVGHGATKTQVSIGESLANLRELRRIARELSEPSWLWITPAPVVPERVAAFPGFRFGQSAWDNQDIAALAEGMRTTLSETVVDLVDAFGSDTRDDLLGPDGVHPTLAGQQVITRAVLRALTSPSHEPPHS
jgi:lysophospholipase L1-like esterase